MSLIMIVPAERIRFGPGGEDTMRGSVVQDSDLLQA